MVTLTDIPALLEPLTGPDRRVDVLIGVALCWRHRTMSKDMRAMHNLMGMSIAHMTEEAERRTTALHHLPRWTGSVDAGISLIPDGWRLAATNHRSHTDAHMAQVLSERLSIVRYAPTLPLAVTQAAIGALIDSLREGEAGMTEPKVWTHHVRIHKPYTTTVADMLQNMLAANVYQEDHPAPTVTLDDAGMLIVYHDTNPEAFIP